MATGRRAVKIEVLFFQIQKLTYGYDRFAETIDLNAPDPVAHKHTPYVVILVKMAEEWAKSHGGSLPSSREEKKAFKVSFPLPFCNH